MKISCIDFETANASRGSACSVGIAVFRDGVLEQSAERLILPHDSCRWFDPFNVAIHNIHASDVADAPQFDSLAPWLFDLLDADLVIAHNAAFDMSVLRAVCDLYDLPYPRLRYFCTCKAARRLWTDLPDHKLDTLCGYLGHRFRHHNAEADAEAAGVVLLALLQSAKVDSPAGLAELLNLQFGTLTAHSYSPCGVRREKKRKAKTENQL